MTTGRGDQDRRLLPRWRTKRSAVNPAELGGTGRQPVLVTSEAVNFPGKLQIWKNTGAFADAIDAVSAALLTAHPEDAQAPLEALRNVGTAKPAVRTLALSVGTPAPKEEGLAVSDKIPDQQSDVRDQIRTLRHLLAAYPRNAFLWGALSRAYLSFGQHEKAEHAMSVALFLAPRSRYVVRSAVRLYTHIRKYSEAHRLLLSFGGMESDPWILSAELAVSSIRGTTSKYVKKARSLAEDANFSPLHRSELNGSLATLELYSGNVRASRKYFAASLEQPTDNSAAQAVWASTNRDVPVRPSAGHVSMSVEALTLQFRADQKWNEALSSCQAWLVDEPFSRRPAIDGSYLASVAVGDLALAERFIEAGLRSNPRSAMLRNNYVVTLAQTGRVEEAARELSCLTDNADDSLPRTTSVATLGLLLFRLGNVEEGREQYKEAIRIAQQSGDARHVALAALYLAMEEQRCETLQAGPAIAFAKDMVARSRAPEVAAMLKRTFRGI